MNFSRSSVSGLGAAVGKRRNEYKDALEPGLYLHVTSHGVKTFFLYRKYRGKPQRIKLGRFPDIPVSVAREQAQKYKARLALGEYEPSAGKPPGMNQAPAYSSLSLADLAEKYYVVRNLKPKTLKDYKAGLKNHLSDWMKKPMASITKQMVVERHRSIAVKAGDKQTGGGATADSVMRTLRTLFRFFKDHHDFPGDNPVETLTVNRLWKTGNGNRRTRYIPRSELAKWLGVFEQLPHATWRDYLLFVLLTGLRKEEAACLEWDTVDLVERKFFVPDTKNGMTLHLPLSSVLHGMLERRRRGSNGRWVFPSVTDSSKPLYPEAIWRKIFRDHGLKLSTHDLRRTFITLAESLDITQLNLKRLMNHKPGNDVTEGYIIPGVGRLRGASEKIAQFVMKEAKGKSVTGDSETVYGSGE